ncbi:alpha-amylase family glycosyl hydrolase [Glaciimonas immobilis]|uniref:Amylosucrase n=1 Tax=Glaciimonas immobilis TaxID=728004 RepID=A0A840RPD6_9BURK|nr:alpha-amylase family glycosyl hydrolase [Glaciimonas immobilis]MBB5198594.1 amylosucrase [Glaciimonas immobilis]
MTIASSALSRMLAVLPVALHAEATQRFAEQSPLLLQRLTQLYGSRADFAEWFANLMESVGLLHAARSVALRAQDTERANSSDWFLTQTMLGYSAYVDRFSGTLRGVTQRIPHLQELGVTYLHLLPFLRARAIENDGGFAVASYDDVEPRLGTVRDLEELTAQLRKAGISLCSDFILNHVADDHAWAQGAAGGDARLRDYFYLFEDRIIPDQFEQTLVQIFPQAAPGNFTWSVAMQAWVWTTFYPYQWDLNYTNPEVLGEMVSALLGLANRGIEVFRLDSTAFLWKREGTNGMNQPEAHWILQILRCITEIAAPGVLLKAEAIVPMQELPAYFGADEGLGRECHLAYHSSLMAAGWAAVAEQRTDLLCEVIKATPVLPGPASWLTYVRCHDDIGWNVLRPELASIGDDSNRLATVSRFFAGTDPDSFSGGTAFQTSPGLSVHGTNGMSSSLVGYDRARTEIDVEFAQRRLILLYGLALAFGGLPLLYMGDEMAFRNDVSEASLAARNIDSRWLQRPHWDNVSYEQRHSADLTTGKVFSAFRRMIHQRQRQNILAADVPRQIIATGNLAVLALKRGEQFIALSNFSEHAATLDLLSFNTGPAVRWFDCLSETVVPNMLELPPWGTMWLERQT